MKKLFVLVALLSIGPICAATPLKLNLAASFAPAKAKIAAGGQADIMMIGDSLEFNVLPYFQQDMHGHYGDAGAGYQGFSLWSGAGQDAGWTQGVINLDSDPHMSLDGLWSSTTARTTASFQQSNQTIQLQYSPSPEVERSARFTGRRGTSPRSIRTR
jgi:hypothetical protein